MKLIILQEKLKQGLQFVEKVLPKSLSLPILNTALFKAEKNFLSLSTTDLEVGIKWWALAKVTKEGELAVPLAVLNNFFGLLPSQQIEIEKKDHNLALNCTSYQTEIKGLSSDDFPIIPEVIKDIFLDIDGSLFCQALEQVVDLASPSSARPEISGVYISWQKDAMRMAATDSFRLGEKTIFLPGLDREISLILPQKAAKQIINIFAQRKGSVKIYFSANQILIESLMEETAHPEIHFISKLIEGDYPAYQDIIPKKHETQIVLSKSELLNHLRAAAVFGGKINEVKLKVNPNKGGVEISSQNPDLGLHASFLPGKIKGSPLEVAFNHRFLTAGLSGIRSAEVSFELQKDDSPATLKPVGDNSYVYVVMPIKAS